MRPSVPDVHITDSQDAELAEYRSLAGQAVVGLIFGLLAPLALVDPMLWSIPALGVFFSWWALRRIRKGAPEIAGRKIAICGLMFSLLFLAAAPSEWINYRRLLSDEARQFSALWLQYMAQDEPQKAYQLSVAPDARQPLNDNLWVYYRNNPAIRERLEGYVGSSPVRTLLALGPRAQVRFYQTAAQEKSGQGDLVYQWYAVTYEEDGEKKSFFMLMKMLRTKLPDGQAGWRVLQTEGGGRPEGW